MTPPVKLQPTNTRTLSDVTTGIASLVWWDFCGTRITPTDLRDKVAFAGMDPSTVPDIDPVAALAQAVREFSVREGKRRVMEAAVASTTPEAVVVNILQRVQESDRRVAKVPVDTLVWDRKQEAWIEPGQSEHSAKLRTMVADRQAHYDGNAVRDYIVAPAVAKAQAFTLKRGMYVVPHLTAGPLVDVQKALDTIESFNLNVAAVQGQEWSSALTGPAQESVRDELQELQAQIDNWRDMASRVRCDTRESVLERFKELRQKAELYSAALEVSMEDLADEIMDMEEVALEVIDLKDEEAMERIQSRTPKKVDPSQAHREAIAAMSEVQLATLWSALCDGDKPDDMEEVVEAIATAMEEQAAA
jgi:hypothetical protein